MRRHLDRGGQGLGEALEAAVIAAGFGEFIEAALGLFDLILWAFVHRRAVGGIDHLLADADQGAADGEIVNGAAVVESVDDRGRLGGEANQILAGGQSGDVHIRR